MSGQPLILITNDDGLHAPGIKYLWQSLKGMAQLVVVAPSVEQSAVGLSITIRQPLRFYEHHWDEGETTVFSVTGTPADCVKLALSVILPRPPDLIVSGVNKGSNAGRNVLYSGTVGAVIEGTIKGIPGIAFSVSDFLNPCYENLENYIQTIVNYAMQHPLPFGTFLNVNFPKTEGNRFEGIKMAKQGREYYIEDPKKQTHPVEGFHYFWLGAKIAQFEEADQSDIKYLEKGYVAVVPIHVENLTDHSFHGTSSAHFECFVNIPK